MRILPISLFTRVAAEPVEPRAPVEPVTGTTPAWSPPGGLAPRCAASSGLSASAPQQELLQALALQGAAPSAALPGGQRSGKFTSRSSGKASRKTGGKTGSKTAGKRKKR